MVKEEPKLVKDEFAKVEDKRKNAVPRPQTAKEPASKILQKPAE
jgi:hypothetical protein